MKKISLYELGYCKHNLLPLGPVGILIGKGNIFFIERDDSSVRHGAASDIPGQINKYALSVVVSFPYMDIPFCPAKFVLQVLPLPYRHGIGKDYQSSLNGGIHAGEELSPEYSHDCFDRQEISLLFCAHPPVTGKTSFCYEAMNVRMEDHRLTPRVQCCNNTGFAPDVLFIEKELIECISDAGKKKIGHGLYVQKPQFIQFMRESEDHMVMTAGEESFFLPLKPLLYPDPVALRTESMSA